MALIVNNRVKETSTTTGTGTLDLGGATTGFQSFVDGIGSGNTTYYTIVGGASWEVGLGTVTAGSPNTLSRTTILESSNADAAVNFAAGTKDVFCTMPAEILKPSMVTKTAAYTVLPTDHGVTINASGTFTVDTSTAATALGEGFRIGIKNAGSGLIQWRANGGALTDTVSTLPVYAGDAVSLQVDGTIWRIVGRDWGDKSILIQASALVSTATAATKIVPLGSVTHQSLPFNVAVGTTSVPVPAGVTKIRVAAQAHFSAVADATRRFVAVGLNGANVGQWPRQAGPNINSATLGGFLGTPTATVSVVGGTDVINLITTQNAAGDVFVTGGWLFVEIVE